MFDKWFVLLQKQLHGECGCLQKLSEWGLEYRSVGCQDSILACIKRLDLCDQPVSNFRFVSLYDAGLGCAVSTGQQLPSR